MTALRTALTAAEREAIAQYERDQNEAAAAAEEAATDKSTTIEDRFLEAFEAMTEDTTPNLMAAFAAIAAFFHDDDPAFHSEVYDRETGETRQSDRNHLQFNQKRMMGNLVSQGVWMLEQEQRRRLYLKRRGEQAARANNNDELGLLELDAARMEYARCVKVNLPILEDYLLAAKTAYRCTTGEEWTKPVKKTAADALSLDDAVSALPSRRRSRL